MIPRATTLALLLAVGACAHGEGGPPAPPDGAALYRRNCAACHRLKSPDEHDAETWRRAVERFGTHLSKDERRLVGDWLAARSHPPR